MTSMLMLGYFQIAFFINNKNFHFKKLGYYEVVEVLAIVSLF